MSEESVRESSSFGTLLRRHRLAAGFSQETLAELARVSVDGISALERGARRRPQRETLELLSTALALNAADKARLEAAARTQQSGARDDPSRDDRTNHNLSVAVTRLYGRDRELADVIQLLATNRLVTLTGSGEIGKTRLALEAGRKMLEDFSDGVWLVELGPLGESASIASAIALALSVREIPDQPILKTVLAGLKEKNVLLILDNCEHLVDEIAKIVEPILRGSFGVRILATSRETLRIGGERAYRLPSLAFPSFETARGLESDAAATYSAIELFVDRACGSLHDFDLTDANSSIVADICRRLDGIPLAIELAAARVKFLTLHELDRLLDERFRVLTSGSRDVLPRYQTLRALIEWSHDLLRDDERRLFRRLSIFINGFTIEGAIAVGCDESMTETDVFDALSSLVDKSLVLADLDEEVVRYRLLESTRAYGREKLAAAGERERCSRLHLRYLHGKFLALNDTMEATGTRKELETTFALELEDVRVALDEALHADVRLGAALLVASEVSSWAFVGLGQEMIVRTEAYLAVLGDEEPGLRAKLCWAIAFIADHVLDVKRQIEYASRALRCARESEDIDIIARSLPSYAIAASRLRRFLLAESALLEAEAIGAVSLRTHLRRLEARALLETLRGDKKAALDANEKLLVEHRRIGDRELENTTIINLAELYFALGDSRRAIELARRLLTIFRKTKNRPRLTIVLTNYAAYLAASGEIAETVEVAHELIRLIEPFDTSSVWIAIVCEPLALSFAMQRDFERAARLEGYADAALRRLGFEREFTEATSYDRLHRILTASLEPDALTNFLVEGGSLSSDDAVALALQDARSAPACV